jgi:ATP phosphoribosyltransferase
LVVAGLKDQYPRGKEETLKVATSYPNITKAYFGEKKQKIRVVKLGGSVELAPLLGLSDVIVDLVETGSTLKANGLKVIEEICEVSAKLVANRISYRFKYESINQLVKRLEEVCP